MWSMNIVHTIVYGWLILFVIGVVGTAAEGRNSQGVAHKRSLPQTVSAIPDLRSSLDTPSSFSGEALILNSPNIFIHSKKKNSFIK